VGDAHGRVDGIAAKSLNENTVKIDMANSNRLDIALKRLMSAADLLEAAVERRAVGERLRLDVDETFAVLQDDRSRLAVELDGALAKVRALEEANSEVERRLGTVGAAIAAVLAQSEPDPES
jgi:hypothetical protein